MLKPAFGISLGCALLAYAVAPTSSASEAGLRSLVVFAGVFLWSSLALYLLSRILPAGASLFAGGGAGPEGSGEGRFVDLEKNAIDRSKLQDLLR